MLAGTIVHCTQTSNFYRVDAICSDLTVANLTFLKNVANTRQVVAKHCHTSSGEDVLQAPRFLVPELCHDMRVKADVMNYAFAFLHLGNDVNRYSGVGYVFTPSFQFPI